jgi:hypothetical protein
MLSEVAIEVRNGENWVSWSYPPTIMAALREPTRWARIDLDVLASLGTYAAVALYEICARYRDNPSGVTSRKPVAWWADALSQAPAGTERREWRKFKNERVKPAVQEINQETDLEIELIEHKQGRAVIEAQFAVRKKRAVPKYRQAPDVVDANLVLRAESLGIREIKLEALIKEFGEERVRQQLDVIERRAANARLPGIDNAYSYLRSLLRNNTVEEPPAPPAPGAAAAEAPPASPASDIAAARQGEANWLNERIASIKAEIQALGAEQRMALVQEAVQDLSQKRLMTAVVARRAAQGDALHGLLGNTVVRIYATRVYGPGWQSPPADLFGARTSQ